MVLLLAGASSAYNTHQPKDSIEKFMEDKETTMKEMPKGKLLLVKYNYRGMAYEVVRDIVLTHEDGQPVIRFTYQDEEQQHVVGDSLFEQARAIIKEEEMYKYQPAYQFDPSIKILDGYKWDFEAVFEGDQRIKSAGRNASPNGNGLNRINQLLQQAARSIVVGGEANE